MKTRLIYFLIGLMVISLIGIIVLQSGWVSDAISEREKEFESRGNNAMNDINEVIGQDEAVFFLKEEFGNMDSLLHNILIIEKAVDGQTDSILIENHHSQRITVSVDDAADKIARRRRRWRIFQGHGTHEQIEIIIIRA